MNSKGKKGQRLSGPAFLLQHETPPISPVKQALPPGEICSIFREPY